MLADLLDKLPTQEEGPASENARALDEAVEAARTVVTATAEDAARAGGWSPEEPLRLTKDRVRWLLHCPRRAVASDAGSPSRSDDVVLGLVVDAAAQLLALGAARPVTVDTAVAFLDAQGQSRVTDHLADLGTPAATKLAQEATTRLDRLDQLWPALPPAWWARVEEPVRVPLAGRSVLLSGRLDILLGGPPTAHPGVIVEVKGGRWHDSARSETHFYSLLLGLRDGRAPTHVVSLAAADGATHVEEVRPAILANVARQVTTALETAASLAAGEVPEARPGSQCTFCPVRPGCPAAAGLVEDRRAA